MITDNEIREVYREDTIGRKYHTPITTKANPVGTDPNPQEATTINLNNPMTYDEFKRLDDSVKVMYLKRLVQLYDATATQISDMFGIAQNTFSTRVSHKLGLKGLFKRRARSASQEEAWNRFLNHGRECRCSLEGYVATEDIIGRLTELVDGKTNVKVTVKIEAVKDVN